MLEAASVPVSRMGLTLLGEVLCRSSACGRQFCPRGRCHHCWSDPGTQYHFAVRTARERDSSEKLDHSPWSEVLTVMMPGTRPSGAPGSAAAPALKAPPMDLMAAVDGTTVNLSWTASTNPNYTSQRLLRRVAGVSPIQWTEMPLGVDVTTYTDKGLTSGVTYRIPRAWLQGQRELRGGKWRFRRRRDSVKTGC